MIASTFKDNKEANFSDHFFSGVLLIIVLEASWASVFESSRLVIGLKWTSDQKAAYVFVAFELN